MFGLAIGIVRGFGTIGLCFLALNFGRADKWWAYAAAILPVAALVWFAAFDQGSAVLGIFPALSFAAVAALGCAMRRRFEWVARI